jgi:uncharacterized metal-binding protein
MTSRPNLPLVYSCSGCSSAAQLANHLALRLDRVGLAEMSCIAGIGGGVPALVAVARKAARTGRPILAIDGCALACARACLQQRGLAPTEYVQLAEDGVRKSYHADFDPTQADRLYDQLVQRIEQQSPVSPKPSSVPGAPTRRTARG